MMKVEIFEHNRIAFENVLKAFKTSNRTCVIHPTGSGKMFIALQLMDKFNHKNIAFITSYSTIKDRIVQDMEATGVEVRNLYIDLYRNIQPICDLDYIILDEFHHAGAPIWGKKLQALLDENPNAKILGLSATPIRYLDDNRDMAEELFNNNIASYMSLEEAIARRILKMPVYVNAIYNFDKIIESYAVKISKIKDPKELNRASRLLEKAKRRLEQSEGLPEILAKYITVKNGRYIVFCKDFEHMELMIEECKDWFVKVNENLDIYVLRSDEDNYMNRFNLHTFEHVENDKLKLLFCVNMLNEGIHCKNDGCIMVRPTQSYNVYIQQLGRVLAVNHGESIVFDIVNNSENIHMIEHLTDIVRGYCEYLERDSYIDIFSIIDELRDFREICNEIDYIISNNIGWDGYYALAKDYYEKYGNLLIPKRYKINGVNLGIWIYHQRQAYNKFKLPKDRIQLLESIGMVWDARSGWDGYYALAKDYYEKYGNLLIPKRYKIANKNLGIWIYHQRQSYKRSELSEDRIRLLEAISMVWVCRSSDHDKCTDWDTGYTLAKDYYNKHGNLLIPQPYVVDGIYLGRWVRLQRVYYNKSELSEDRIRLLESIDMIWDVHEYNWNRCYTLAKDYYEKYDNLLIPLNYTINNIKLGRWIYNQRIAYKDFKLSKERIDLLESIGMVWDLSKK